MTTAYILNEQIKMLPSASYFIYLKLLIAGRKHPRRQKSSLRSKIDLLGSAPSSPHIHACRVKNDFFYSMLKAEGSSRKCALLKWTNPFDWIVIIILCCCLLTVLLGLIA